MHLALLLSLLLAIAAQAGSAAPKVFAIDLGKTEAGKQTELVVCAKKCALPLHF
jgi:hypothetical protein